MPAEAAEAEPARSDKIARLLLEIEALIADDEAADRQITGGWRTFSDILAAAHTHTWDAYSVDLSTDAESFRRLAHREQEAVKRVFGTIYRAESIVDECLKYAGRKDVDAVLELRLIEVSQRRGDG